MVQIDAWRGVFISNGLESSRKGELPAMRTVVQKIVSDLRNGLSLGRAGSRPAWPVLLLVQVALIGVIAGAAWSLSSVEPPENIPVIERLSGLNNDGADDSVRRALSVAQSPLALKVSDQRDLASFLARSAQDINMDWVGVEFEPSISSDGSQTVIARLTLRGSPFLVPVYLARIEDYQALGVVERFEAQPLGEDGDMFRLDIGYTRPPVVETEWVAEALPENDDAVQTLRDAAQLQAWRTYAEDEPLREARARAVRQALSRTLPAGLTTLHQQGTGFLWTPAHGLEPLRSGH